MRTKPDHLPTWEEAVDAIRRHLGDGDVREALRRAALWERNMGWDKQMLLNAAAGK